MIKIGQKNILPRALCLVSALALLCSCGIYNKFELPSDESPIVADFENALLAEPDSSSLPYIGWKEIFTDTLLQTYIEKALKSNKDLDNARLNIDIANAQLKGAKLSYLPSLSLNPNGGSASYDSSPLNWSYSIPAGISWEIDVFGKILNSKRQAESNKQMMLDYEQAVHSQIVCGVAGAYYGIMLLEQQLSLSRRTAEIWKDQVATMELLKEAGRVNEAAVVQSRANYYSILASIPDIEQQITVMHNTLSLLMNEYPQQWPTSGNMDFDIPATLTTGIPVSYLAVRPDVRAAERNLAMTFYATNRARAAFYPGLSITAQGGFTNLLGSVVSNPGKWFIQLAGSLVAPIFSRGQNIANLEVTKAQQTQALNNFEYTVLSAAADVSDALVQLEKNAEKRKYTELQVDQLEKSVEYTQDLLTYDKATYLEVLTARSGLLNVQITAINCWHDRVAALISLYQAVGGGR